MSPCRRPAYSSTSSPRADRTSSVDPAGCSGPMIAWARPTSPTSSARKATSFGSPLVYTNEYGGHAGRANQARPRLVLGDLRHAETFAWGSSTTTSRRPNARQWRRTSSRFPFEVVDCLNLNKQDVPALGSKFNLRPFAGNLITVSNSFGQRLETIRSADDLHPTFETTNKITFMRAKRHHVRPRGVLESRQLGSQLEIADQHTFSDRWLVDVSFGHHCWCATIMPQTARAPVCATDARADHGHLGTNVGSVHRPVPHQQHVRPDDQLLPAGPLGR